MKIVNTFLKVIHGLVFRLAWPVGTHPGGRFFEGKYETFNRIAIIKFLRDQKPFIQGRVLDIGVGTWDFPRQLFGGVCDYVTADSMDHPNVDVQVDLSHLYTAFQEASFDCVLCTDVLEHVEKPWQAVEQIHRILKPGGRLVLTVPYFYPVHQNELVRDYWRFSEAGIRALLLNQAKFTKVVISTNGPRQLPLSFHGIAIK